MTPTERAAIEQKIEVFEGKIAALREMLIVPCPGCGSRNKGHTEACEAFNAVYDGLIDNVHQYKRGHWGPNEPMTPQDLNKVIRQTMAEIRTADWEIR